MGQPKYTKDGMFTKNGLVPKLNNHFYSYQILFKPDRYFCLNALEPIWIRFLVYGT